MRNRRKFQSALTALILVASAAFPNYTDSGFLLENVYAQASDPEFLTEKIYQDKNEYLIITGAENVGEKLVIPSEINGMAVIGVSGDAFNNNKMIKTLVISEGIIQIDDGAFSWCTNLDSITIPNTVRKVSLYSFFGTPWLRKKMDSDDFVIVGDGILINYNNHNTGKEVVVPSEVTVIANSAFSGCSFIESVKLGKKVERIEKDAFLCCSKLNKINIGSNVKEICESAFFNCDFRSLSIPKYTQVGEINIAYCYDEDNNKTIPNSIVLKGYNNSDIQIYAELNRIKFEEYDNCYDVNKDCTVDISDISYEKNYLAMVGMDNGNEYDADVNNNDKADIFDLLRLKKHILSGEPEKETDRNFFEIYKEETTAPVTTAVTNVSTSAAKTTTATSKTSVTAPKTTTAVTTATSKTSTTATKTTPAVTTAALNKSVTTADSKSSVTSGSAAAKTSLTGNNKGE